MKTVGDIFDLIEFRNQHKDVIHNTSARASNSGLFVYHEGTISETSYSFHRKVTHRLLINLERAPDCKYYGFVFDEATMNNHLLFKAFKFIAMYASPDDSVSADYKIDRFMNLNGTEALLSITYRFHIGPKYRALTVSYTSDSETTTRLYERKETPIERPV